MVDRSAMWRLSKIQEELENVEFPPPPPPNSMPSPPAHIPQGVTGTHSLDRTLTGRHQDPPPPGPHGGSLRRRTDPTYRPDQQQQEQYVQQQQQSNQQYVQQQTQPQQQYLQQHLQQQYSLKQQYLQQQQPQQHEQYNSQNQQQPQQQQLQLKQQQYLQHQQQLNQNQYNQQQQTQIYDKAVINPEVSRKQSIEAEAVRKISEKYDSLGRNGMGLLKAYAEQQHQQQQQEHQRSRSFDNILDSTAENAEFRSSGMQNSPALNRDLLVAGGYRRVLEGDRDSPPPPPNHSSGGPPASVGADPSFPPPPTQDELTNASGIVTRNPSSVGTRRGTPVIPGVSPGVPRVPSVDPTRGQGISQGVSQGVSPRVSSPSQVLSQGVPSSLKLDHLEGGALTEAEVAQVEMFYRSHKSEVWVCQCTAHLHLGSVKITTSLMPKGSDKKQRASAAPQHTLVGGEMVENWKYVRMGVPVFLIDSSGSGASKGRGRQLHILLAEKGTGFTLWRDKIDHLSGYKSCTSVFHTMHLSGDHNNMAGFAFDDAHAAAEFMFRWKAISGNPDDDILNLSGKSSKKRKKEEKKPKFKAPNKSAISAPCCFTHVTKLDRTDGLNLLGTKGPNRQPQQLGSPVKMSRVSSLIPSESHTS